MLLELAVPVMRSGGEVGGGGADPAMGRQREADRAVGQEAEIPIDRW